MGVNNKNGKGCGGFIQGVLLAPLNVLMCEIIEG